MKRQGRSAHTKTMIFSKQRYALLSWILMLFSNKSVYALWMYIVAALEVKLNIVSIMVWQWYLLVFLHVIREGSWLFEYIYRESRILVFTCKHLSFWGGWYSCLWQNDFNFEKRDWMTVRPKELPRGSQLVREFFSHLRIKTCKCSCLNISHQFLYTLWVDNGAKSSFWS